MDATAKTFPEKMGFEAFLAFLDARPDEKWELYDGVPVAMAGGTRSHSRLAVRIISALEPQARLRGCDVHNSDFLVHKPGEPDFSAFPDAWIRCGHLDPRARTATDPIVIVEVLSPSTIIDDRGYKLRSYQEILTVRQILLVYPDERRVESWERGPEQWTVVVHADGAVPIPAVEGSLVVDEIYDGVDLA